MKPPHAYQSRSLRLITRGCIRHSLSFQIDHLAHQRSFCRELTVNGSFSLQLAKRSTPGEHVHFHTQLVSGDNRPSKTSVIDCDEIKKFLFPVLHFLKQQYSPRLCHGLNNQHTWHDRLVGKMALKETLIDANVFYSNNSLPSLHFFDCIDQQEWIAVRENLLDPGNVEDHRCPQSFSLLFIG